MFFGRNRRAARWRAGRGSAVSEVEPPTTKGGSSEGSRSDNSAATKESPKAENVGARAWRSLGARIALWYVTVTLIAFGAAAAVVAFHTQRQVQRAGESLASDALQRFRTALEREGPEALRALVLSGGGARRSVSVRLTDEQNFELLQLSSDVASAGAAGVLRGTHARTSEASIEDWHVAGAQVSLGRTLEVVVHNDEASGVWREAKRLLWLIFGLGLGAAVLGALVISRRALRPLSDLALATQSIVASGNLALRVPMRGTGDDLERLAELVNRMLQRNESLMRAMRESLDNVAHDLRTPLTRLRTHAEIALHDTADPGAAREALADVLEESDRVLSLLTTLMDITEATTGVMRLEKRAEDLASIAREAVELYDFVAAERGIHITTQLTHGVTVSVDRRRLLQVCANLLDNAIKYSEAGGSVEVRVSRSPTEGSLTVADFGIGIPAEDRPRVWDRLFRGDRSRTERGLGLGLSLVKAVVEAHGGQVRLRDDRALGSEFEVVLPLAAPQNGQPPRTEA